jgi:hypothetical protein
VPERVLTLLGQHSDAPLAGMFLDQFGVSRLRMEVVN